MSPILLSSKAARSVSPLTDATCRRRLLNPRVVQALPSAQLSTVSTTSEQASLALSEYLSLSSASAYGPARARVGRARTATSLPYTHGPEGVDQDNDPQSQWLAGEPLLNIKPVHPPPSALQCTLLPRLFYERRSFQKPNV